MAESTPNEASRYAQEHSYRRPPTVSSEHTRIYPVRSLLQNVQPDHEGATQPVGLHSLRDTRESASTILSHQRIAKWTETLPPPATSDTTHIFPKYRGTPRVQPTTYEGETSRSGFTDWLTRLNRPVEPLSSPPVPHSLKHTHTLPSMKEGPNNDTLLHIQEAGSSDSSNTSMTFAARLDSDSVAGLGGGEYVHLLPTSSSTPSSGTDLSTKSFEVPSGASNLNQHAPRGLGDSHGDQSALAERIEDDAESSALIPSSYQSGCSVGSSEDSSSSTYHVTHRFKYVETEHGHQLFIGREGELERCEDEPIRTPGAVQGYGVLIALEKDDKTSNLVVRQVSENSTEILGLTPQFLFRLKCFSQTLPDHQADVLWDNIQYLPAPEEDSPFDGASEDSPHVFLLSGWGEPGSIINDCSNDDESVADIGSGTTPSPSIAGSTANKRSWTCWVAAHRPKRTIPPPTSADAQTYARSLSIDLNDNPIPFFQDAHDDPPPFIILEFELENDIYNPIYPIPDLDSPFAADLPAQWNEGTFGDGVGLGLSGSPADLIESAVPAGSDPQSPNYGAPPTPDALKTLALALGSGSTMPSGSTLGSGTPPKYPGLDGEEDWYPSRESILRSTTSQARSIKALERVRLIEHSAYCRQGQPLARRAGRDVLPASSRPQFSSAQGGLGRDYAGSPGSEKFDVFSVLGQINQQLNHAPNLPTFLDVVVGVIKDLTQFHRVLAYQFDDRLNGQVVAELVDWSQTHDLYKGLHFPASDIPPQARDLYKINKVRSLYNRSQLTARLVSRTKADAETPLDLTHSYLRAMSPIHLKYLENMDVRGTIAISIIAFDELWGIICCHSYGEQGMRVSFPVRQMLRLLSDSISRGVERLIYAQKLHARKLIRTIPSEAHPTGYIISDAEDLLGLFDADYGILVIGDGAKILGPNEHGQDLLVAAEYLRLKRFKLMQVSQEVTRDFPDMNLPSGLNVIAGLLYVPLSPGGRDFIAFLRKGELRDVTWAGRPVKKPDGQPGLEPRSSFKAWVETVHGRCKAWTDDKVETAGILALIYGKFIEVWREKELALKARMILSSASHEGVTGIQVDASRPDECGFSVRTPLKQIIHYIELALGGPLDEETRDNLDASYAASKNLLFTINDLLDLARLESGGETSSNDPFNLYATIEEAIGLYRSEAFRRKIAFETRMDQIPWMVIGDPRKIRTVIANIAANAVKFTQTGTITVECKKFEEPPGLRDDDQVVIEVTVSDTGCGIDNETLESIFREFEQVDPYSLESKPSGLGLGLAVCARTIKQLGGQLRVDSTPGQGSRFSVLIPFMLSGPDDFGSSGSSINASPNAGNTPNKRSELDDVVEALQSTLGANSSAAPIEKAIDKRTDINSTKIKERAARRAHRHGYGGEFEVEDSMHPVRSVKIDPFDVDSSPSPSPQDSFGRVLPNTAKAYSGATHYSRESLPESPNLPRRLTPQRPATSSPQDQGGPLRVLVVDDEHVNRTILSKRLRLDGHIVVTATNGQEAVNMIELDRAFDCILMDIQMPLKNGFEASAAIRAYEKAKPQPLAAIRQSTDFNGRIPIFAVSASLLEEQRQFMATRGMDGWILKPVDFKRLRVLLSGVTDVEQRSRDVYYVGCNWERGGWMTPAVVSKSSSSI